MVCRIKTTLETYMFDTSQQWSSCVNLLEKYCLITTIKENYVLLASPISQTPKSLSGTPYQMRVFDSGRTWSNQQRQTSDLMSAHFVHVLQNVLTQWLNVYHSFHSHTIMQQPLLKIVFLNKTNWFFLFLCCG